MQKILGVKKTFFTRILLSIFLVFLMIVPSYIPSADAYFNSEKDAFKDRIYDFLLGLVDRFPHLGNLSFFNRLLNMFNTSVEDDNQSNDTTIDNDLDGFTVPEGDCNDNDPNINPDACELCGDGIDQDCDGEIDEDCQVTTFDNNHSIFGSMSQEEIQNESDFSVMDEKDHINASDNVTIFPESGQILFTGHGNIDVDLAFDFNGTIVTLTGDLTMGPEETTLSVFWNVSQGYFELNSDGCIDFSDIVFGAAAQENQITFLVDLISLKGGGYLIIDQNGYTGSILCDGILNLEGISFDFNLDTLIQTNITLAGSFYFSGTGGDAQDLEMSWDENGFSANGSFSLSSYLEIQDFYLSIENPNASSNEEYMLVGVDTIILDTSSVSFNFEEINESLAICRVSGRYIQIDGLSLLFGNFSTYIDSIQITNELSLTLYIDDGSYITAEEGHISISGNMAMNIDTVVSINNTLIEIEGIFVMESLEDSLDIWWNKTNGFFCINSTSRVSLLNFKLRLDDSIVKISWNKLVLNPGASIRMMKLNDSNKTRIVFQGGIVQALDIQIDAKIGNVSLSVGSLQFMHFEQNNDLYFDVVFGDNSTEISANMLLGESITIQELEFVSPQATVTLDAFTVFGYWSLYSNETVMSLEIVGSIQIVDLMIEGQAHIPYLSMSGSSYMFMGGGEVEFWVSLDGYFAIGVSGLGSFYIRIFGYAHMIWDLETGEIYGEFGYVVSGGGSIGFGLNLGVAYVSGISISFLLDGTGSFVIENDSLYLEVSGGFAASIGLGVGMHIDNFAFGCAVSVFATGYYSAYLNYNFRTGEMSMAGSVTGAAVIYVHNIQAHGNNVYLDYHDWDDIMGVDPGRPVRNLEDGFSNPGPDPLETLLYSISIYIDTLELSTTGGILIVASFFASASYSSSGGLGFGFGLLITGIQADLDFDLDIENIEIMSIKPILIDQTTGDSIEFLFSIGSVELDGIFKLEAIAMQDTQIRLSGELGIENINFLIEQVNSDGLLDISIGDIVISGDIIINMPNLCPGRVFFVAEGSNILTITAPEAMLSIEEFSIEGVAADLFGGTSTLDFSLDSISLSTGGLSISFDTDQDYMLDIFNNSIKSQSGIWMVDGNQTYFTSGLLEILNNAAITIEGDGSLNIEGLNIGAEFNDLIFGPDNDGDGILDFYDSDMDGDGYANENDLDTDGDGILNTEDNDIDGDGIPNADDPDPYNPSNSPIGVSSNFSFSADVIAFSFEGCLILNANGTIEANALLDIYFENIYFGLEDTFIENIVNDLDINLDTFEVSIAEGQLFGHIQVYAGGNGSTIYDFKGYGHIYGLEWTISGENINGGGNFSGEGIVYIYFINNSDGDFDFIHVSFVGEVHTNLSIQGTIPMSEVIPGGLPLVGNNFNWSFNLLNFSGGEGVVGFEIDATGDNISAYLVNTHTDATWDAFNFSIADGLLSANISTFLGELQIDNFLNINMSIIESCNGLFSAIGGILNFLFGGEFPEFEGLLDPDNWEISTNGGFESIWGFDFSSDMGCIFEGDIYSNYASSFSFQSLYVQPGTVGYFDISVNDDFNFLITFHTDQGYAEGVFSINLGNNYDLLIPINSNAENYNLPIGTLFNVMDSIQDGEMIDDLLDWLQNQEVISDLFDLAQNLWIWVEDDNRGIPFGAWLSEQIENFLENYGMELPDYWREYLENLSRDLNETICFLAGTQIEMSDGSLKNIENIQVGDKVKSYDESTGLWKTGRVSKVFHHSPEEMTDYYLVINNDLSVTPNHPIMVNGNWINAGDLEIGDVYGGNIITSIEKLYNRVPTYNFEVLPYHTYKVIWGKAKTSSIAHNEDGGEESTAGDKLDLSDICFLEGTPIAMANPNYPIKSIETIRPGDEIISYFPAGGVFNSTVRHTIFHREYEMIEGYVGITLELLATNQSALFGAGLIPQPGSDTSDIETFTVNVTPDHPLLVTSENPLQFQVQPMVGGGGIKTEIVKAGDIQPGMYTFGGKVISVEHHPNERKRSYHLITDNPYPYLVVAPQQEGMVQFLAELIQSQNKEDENSPMIAGMVGGMWYMFGAFDKDEDGDGDGDDGDGDDGDGDGDDGDGDDGDGDDGDGVTNYSIPASAGIVYFYYNPDLFDYRYIYAYFRSKTNADIYENYAYYNWETETTQIFDSTQDTLENQYMINITPSIT